MTIELTSREQDILDTLRERALKDRPPSKVRPEAPEPDGRRIRNLLIRLDFWLQSEGLLLQPNVLDAIAASSDPWAILRNTVTAQGAGIDAEELEDRVRTLHEEEYRIGFTLDAGREYTDIHGTPKVEGDDGSRYVRLKRQLMGAGDSGFGVADSGLGLSEAQADQVLAEWGYLNPVLFDVLPEIENMAEALAVMRATGDYTGPITPEQLLLQAPTIESAYDLLRKDYSGGLSFENFTATLSTETGVADTPEENAAAAAAAEAGRPTLRDEPLDEEVRKPIGVPVDFVARSAPRPHFGLRGIQGRRRGLDVEELKRLTPGPAQAQSPEYFEGDQFNILNGLSFEQTMLYQSMLVDAGWLSEEDFRSEQGNPGGFATWDAMALAMTVANRTIASSWIDAAKEAAAARKAAGADRITDEPVPVYTPGVYLRPDPDYLRQVVKQTFRSQLGREPTAQEVQGLIGSLSAEFRGAFDVEEAKARAIFAQDVAATEASLGPVDPVTGERVPEPLTEEEGEFRTVAPGVASLGDVDPLASFAERFEALFANELSRNRERETQREARSDIMGSIFATDAAVGGGR